MTGRGGAEGYIFVATRVLPAEGKVEARGRPPRGKKVKAQDVDGASVKRESSPLESPLKKQKVDDTDTSKPEIVVDNTVEMPDVDIKTDTV
jgi:tRNA (adenine-N(1)-)-methyltransferase non-catalytic subunit